MSYDRTYKLTNRDYYFLFKLAWTPSFALKQSFLHKSLTIQLRTFKPSNKNIPVVLSSSPI